MGFILRDSFNYSPVRKMAEAITFRSAADGTPNCGPSAGNADATATPYSLEMYYSEDYRTNGDEYHNRPFSSFNARGDITWKDVPMADYGGDTLKLNDVSGDDGAAKLVIKPGWLVRLKIGAKFQAGGYQENYDEMGLLEDFEDGVNPNIIRVDEWDQGRGASDAGYYYTIVLLDGDKGDYVSVDLDDEHSDIGQFVIKVGGVSYSYAGKLDEGNSDDAVRIELLGVSYKPCFTTDDEEEEEEEDEDEDDILITGCMSENASNYNGIATEPCTDCCTCNTGYVNVDSGCAERVAGCLDSNSLEYNSYANTDDGSCISCTSGFIKNALGICDDCDTGYTKDAAGNCYLETEESKTNWMIILAVAGIAVMALS